MKCGGWRSVSQISCGSSPQTACQVDATHTGPSMTHVALNGYFLEFRASLPSTVCRFAPVITRGVTTAAAIDKTSTWTDWQYRA